MIEEIPDYEIISVLDYGTFGYVLEVYDFIKDMHIAIQHSHKVGEKISREYEILLTLKECEYIIKFIGIFYSIYEEK